MNPAFHPGPANIFFTELSYLQDPSNPKSCANCPTPLPKKGKSHPSSTPNHPAFFSIQCPHCKANHIIFNHLPPKSLSQISEPTPPPNLTPDLPVTSTN